MASYSDSDSPTAITNNTAVPPNPFADFPPPNFINPETRAPLVIGINVTFVTLAAFFVVLRIWSRRVILGYLNPEDWLIAISWVCIKQFYILSIHRADCYSACLLLFHLCLVMVRLQNLRIYLYNTKSDSYQNWPGSSCVGHAVRMVCSKSNRKTTKMPICI